MLLGAYRPPASRRFEVVQEDLIRYKNSGRPVMDKGTSGVLRGLDLTMAGIGIVKMPCNTFFEVFCNVIVNQYNSR